MRKHVNDWCPDGQGWYRDGVYNDRVGAHTEHISISSNVVLADIYSAEFGYLPGPILSVDILTAVLNELGYDVVKRF